MLHLMNKIMLESENELYFIMDWSVFVFKQARNSAIFIWLLSAYYWCPHPRLMLLLSIVIVVVLGREVIMRHFWNCCCWILCRVIKVAWYNLVDMMHCSYSHHAPTAPLPIKISAKDMHDTQTQRYSREKNLRRAHQHIDRHACPSFFCHSPFPLVAPLPLTTATTN